MTLSRTLAGVARRMTRRGEEYTGRNGFLWGQQVPKAESWETPYLSAMLFAFVGSVVVLANRPDTRTQTIYGDIARAEVEQ